MNRTKIKLLRRLPEVGILILSSSLFLNWFSCPIRPDIQKDLSYFLSLYRSNPSNGFIFYPSCLALYLLFLAFSIYFLKRRDLIILFLAFSLFLFLQLAFMVWAEKEFGYHRTIDYPCYPDLGFWLHALGLAVITIGSCFRLGRCA